MHQPPETMQPALSVPYSHSLGGPSGHSKEGKLMAILALSHTAIEHRLYLTMLGEASKNQHFTGSFGVRRLMVLTGLSSFSSVRRGCMGLVKKQSVEPVKNDAQERSVYRVYRPGEVFARRDLAGMEAYPKELRGCESSRIFNLIIEKVAGRQDLSRREAMVVLCCSEGLSNAEIGNRLNMNEKTVKYHLKNIFVKLGARRRGELLTRLLA